MMIVKNYYSVFQNKWMEKNEREREKENVK